MFNRTVRVALISALLAVSAVAGARTPRIYVPAVTPILDPAKTPIFWVELIKQLFPTSE